EDQIRVADERDAEIEATLLAAGERLDSGVALLAEADELDHLVDVARPLVVAREHPVRLRDGEVRPELRLLQHDADLLAVRGLRAGRIEAEHLDTSPVPRAVALQNLQGRRPSGARGGGGWRARCGERRRRRGVARRACAPARDPRV